MADLALAVPPTAALVGQTGCLGGQFGQFRVNLGSQHVATVAHELRVV